MAFVACHGLYFVNLRGDILLERVYKSDVDRSIAENFRTHILNNKLVAQSPVRTLGSYTFVYLRHADIYLLCITRNNTNIMMAFQFMSSLVELFKEYFGGDLNERSIRNNFVLMYELLDEAMDNGYPQYTDHTVLSSLITQKGFKGDLADLALDLISKKKKEEPAANATLQVTGAVSWRKEGLRYKKNEVFLDIIETVNVLVSASGVVLREDVTGKMVMKALLSDMPELRIGLNDAAQDITFHQCVNLGQYEANKVITFVPPDGEFELMRYRCTENIAMPFKIVSAINDMSRTRIEVAVTVKANFSSKLTGTGVMIVIPVPDSTSKAKILVTSGKAKYDATKHGLVWKIGRFPGESEQTLRAEVLLISGNKVETKPWSRPPISMTYKVNMFSASGMRVAYLNVTERRMGSAYKVEKWVRKVAQSGDYMTRC